MINEWTDNYIVVLLVKALELRAIIQIKLFTLLALVIVLSYLVGYYNIRSEL